jgi:hypothetical protein
MPRFLDCCNYLSRTVHRTDKFAAYLNVVGILPSVAKEAAGKPKEPAMANFNSVSMASHAHPALGKVLLATFLTASVMLVGLADARSGSLDVARMHDASFRSAGIGDAGEGASFRTSERGDAGEGASFRTSERGVAARASAMPEKGQASVRPSAVMPAKAQASGRPSATAPEKAKASGRPSATAPEKAKACVSPISATQAKAPSARRDPTAVVGR